MSATVDVQTNRVFNVIAVPIQAVTTRDTAKKESTKAELTPEQIVSIENYEKELAFYAYAGATLRLGRIGLF